MGTLVEVGDSFTLHRQFGAIWLTRVEGDRPYIRLSLGQADAVGRALVEIAGPDADIIDLEERPTMDVLLAKVDEILRLLKER